MLGLVPALFFILAQLLGWGSCPLPSPELAAWHSSWCGQIHVFPDSDFLCQHTLYQHDCTAVRGISLIYWDCQHSNNPASTNKARLYLHLNPCFTRKEGSTFHL